MTEYSSVTVKTLIDGNGQIMPTDIVCKEKNYHIARVLHISQPDDMVTAYTVLIDNKHQKLMFNGYDWRILSSAV